MIFRGRILLNCLLLVASSIGARTQTFLTNGLVAHYPFQGNANDASGNGNHGSAINAQLADDRSGFENASYAFNGLDSVITVPHNEALNFENNSDFTISLWAAFDVPEETADLPPFYLISKDNGGGARPKWIFGWGVQQQINIRMSCCILLLRNRTFQFLEDLNFGSSVFLKPADDLR